MTIKTMIAALAVVTLMGSSLSVAQTTPAPAPATTPAATPAATPMKMKKAMTPESAACYADADKQNLHGKARKSFHRKCLKDAKKAKS